MVKSNTITITVSSPPPSLIPGSITGVTVNGVPVANGGNAGSFPLGSAITIIGTLLDTNGAPLSGWTMEDLSSAGKVQATAVTNANGQFTFSGAPAAKGTFTTHIAAKGYETTVNYTITFTIT